jgi:putative tricarboxylic transport membrane protein
MLAAGVAGSLMRAYGYEPAILVLCFVLGPLLEQNLRQSLLLSDGSFGIFVTRPISAAFLALAIVVLATAVVPLVNRRRRTILEAGG